ncbi:MAG: hydantoinase B/oxoprolinase family protein [Planctomycetes bacterium]|nr:hydantoinase B/oxoprolinase family protein [Planctomycetota bacterium]MCH9775819.1 hydantoinase B/oxoprolinase family protein [Planctomycetota bacterium]MCH9793506.1 hydantoinase B/oxoprolinase family protein [Planctomycetota bacterium]
MNASKIIDEMTDLKNSKNWEFWIDVGGTFTDCIARSPENEFVPFKTLSSGITKGRVQQICTPSTIVDPSRQGDPADFWQDYQIEFLNEEGQSIHSAQVTTFDTSSGGLSFTPSLPGTVKESAGYELSSGEEAPVLAIRWILGLKKSETISNVSVKLGTTRGTNALLTRNGARTAFITTKGFADVLLIGNQDRPRLFDLVIQKPEPLFETAVEIDERITAEGSVLVAPDPATIRKQLEELQTTGVKSLAICLLHSFANPDHEELVAKLAQEVGFDEISVSSRLSPLIKIVSRGDTTVVDAYLNPILKDYIKKLRTPLNHCSLKLMTSAGGLVDADHFVGKDSILSGPAGGVIGYSRVAEVAGFPKSIGFDMGGTSTDVSRFDGMYEREFETRKAGVRIVAPMLSIETVAAGGGSICGFDGIKLHVGPESAGANPGPACYGRGGPLTVTDLNLYLGKIIPSRFPFTLDRTAVEHRLTQLCQQIATSPMGKTYTPLELAEGFLQIANANMVRAIRNISVARGYDPADYVLVSFGGAGSQHACAIARALGIREILIHPYSGILSAFGIGQADVRRFGQQSVLKPWTEELKQDLHSRFEQLDQSVREEVRTEGIPPERIDEPQHSLEMRYLGTDATIQVLCQTGQDELTRFEQEHHRLYGYVHQARAVEVTTMRTEIVGRMEEPNLPASKIVSRVPTPLETTETHFQGTSQQSAVYLREDLLPGDRISGPAIICEPISTVIIDSGFDAEILSRGETLILHSDKDAKSQELISTEADPVMLEIFNNLFASIAEQMGITLQKTSISTNVKERLDFSCAVFSATGDLVVNAPHIPVHLGAMSETVKRIIADNPDLAPGDVYVTNDPYRGGSHLPDVTVITPVHHPDSKELLFFTASRAHHAEIGGIVPGSMPPFSKTLADEGALIRNFKLVDRGESREHELRELLLSGAFPSRSVVDNLADVSAQVAANLCGVTLLNDLVSRYSLPVVQAYMRHIQQAATKKMQLALEQIEDGVYAFTDHLDNGAPLSVQITIQGSSATVDFTGTGPVLETNLNANRAIVNAAVLYVFRTLIQEDIPLNSGVLTPIKIILPECFLNPPERDTPAECAAMVGGNVETSQRIVDTLLGALKKAAASQGTMNNLTFGDETFGYYETICGGSGATKDSDGTDAVHTHMTNTRLTDAEIIERRYPVRLHEFSIRKGSGGAGRKQGGAGILRRIEFLKPLKISLISERRAEYPPFGLEGGAPGQNGENLLHKANQTEAESLGGKFSISVEAGDILTIKTPGGGGFGKQES